MISPLLTIVELLINNVNAIENIVIAYTENTVAPKMLFRLNSIIPAMSCAVAPNIKIQGIIRDFSTPDASFRSADASTNAATASPIKPSAAGSAIDSVFTGIFVLETFFLSVKIAFFCTNYLHVSQYRLFVLGGCSPFP